MASQAGGRGDTGSPHEDAGAHAGCGGLAAGSVSVSPIGTSSAAIHPSTSRTDRAPNPRAIAFAGTVTGNRPMMDMARADRRDHVAQSYHGAPAGPVAAALHACACAATTTTNGRPRARERRDGSASAPAPHPHECLSTRACWPAVENPCTLKTNTSQNPARSLRSPGAHLISRTVYNS